MGEIIQGRSRRDQPGNELERPAREGKELERSAREVLERSAREEIGEISRKRSGTDQPGNELERSVREGIGDISQGSNWRDEIRKE